MLVSYKSKHFCKKATYPLRKNCSDRYGYLYLEQKVALPKLYPYLTYKAQEIFFYLYLPKYWQKDTSLSNKNFEVTGLQVHYLVVWPNAP